MTLRMRGRGRLRAPEDASKIELSHTLEDDLLAASDDLPASPEETRGGLRKQRRLRSRLEYPRVPPPAMSQTWWLGLSKVDSTGAPGMFWRAWHRLGALCDREL
eukprot:365974-Chlamydomonas_euryale.AAC.11